MEDEGRNLLNVISARALLSFSYGFLNVLLSLYLHSIGYSFLTIGEILASAILISASLSFLLSAAADHFGRKTMLVALFLLFSAASISFLLVKNPVILAVLSGIGSFTGSGGGPIGSGGPFGAVQTALITEATERRNFSRILSIASASGILASSGGAFLIGLVETKGIDVYYLFYVAGAMGLISALISATLHDFKVRNEHFFPTVSWRTILKLSVPTIPNGVGLGFISPIFSLWFNLRFGLTSGQIGELFGLSNLMAVLFMLLIPRIVSVRRELAAIIATRIVSSFSLIFLAIVPFFPVSAFLYALRNAMQMGGIPIRQSFSMGMVKNTERATASGTTSLVRTGFSSVSPTFSGSMLSSGIELPPLVAGVITLADPILYYILFRKSFRERMK